MGDLTIATAFTPGQQNVGDVELNAAVNNATINTSFVTGKSAVSANPDPSTYLVLTLNPSGTAVFYKATLNNLVFNHTGLIKDRTALTAPVGADALLLQSSVADAPRKLTLNSLIDGAVAFTTPVKADKVGIYDSTGLLYKGITLENLLKVINDLTAFTAPIAGDKLAIYDSTGTAAKNITLAALISGAVAVSAPDKADLLWVNSAGALKKVDLQTLITGLTAKNPPVDADVMQIWDAAGAALKKLTLANLKTYIVPAGSILQVLQAQKIDTTSLASGLTAYQDISGLSQAITPRDVNSKILVTLCLNGSADSQAMVRILRGATAIGVGTAAGTRVQASITSLYESADGNTAHTMNITWLDSPALATAVTYKAQAIAPNATKFNVNTSFTDADSTFTGRAVSTLTVMEVAG